MIEPDKALRMIVELISAEVEATKEENFRRAGITKVTIAREKRAIQALFVALTGRKATDDEMTDLRNS